MSSVFDEFGSAPLPSGLESPIKRSKTREHLSSSDVVAGKRKLSDMVELAFSTLEDAARFADFPTAVKAAQIILDRAGFGPKSTVDINATTIDLTALTRDELAERALKIAAMVRQGLPSQQVIDVGKTETVN